MTYEALDARLASAAEYVRQGAVFADIGTDHAHLPIFLLQTGKISAAVAADIARGPLLRAEENAKKHNLYEKITFRLTDGLTGLSSLGITDIAVCGMGGEMISMILEREPFVKNEKIRLILQPMSKQDTLRRYLAKNGFLIISETLSRAAGRVYSCICAEYSGKPYEMTEAEYLVGNPVIKTDRDKDNYAWLIDKKRVAMQKRIDGVRQSGERDEYAEATLAQLDKIRRDLYDSI